MEAVAHCRTYLACVKPGIVMLAVPEPLSPYPLYLSVLEGSRNADKGREGNGANQEPNPVSHWCFPLGSLVDIPGGFILGSLAGGVVLAPVAGSALAEASAAFKCRSLL